MQDAQYGITSDKRQTAFFAQIYIETGLLRTVTESGKGTYNSKLPMTKYYAAFYGRGLMQLTWASAYEKYGQFRSFPNNSSDRYVDERITATSTHYWAAPTSRANGASNEDPHQWAPAYDPDIIASNCYNACDSACFFWISKSFLGQKNINRIADQGITSETIGKISVLINGGSHGYENRQRYAAFIDRYRSNTVSVIPTEKKTYLRQIIHNVNGHTAWRTSGEVSNFFVNYKAQREQE